MGSLFLPLLGGALIGLSAAVLLLFHGRIAGITGIVAGLFSAERGELGWRVCFVLGLLGGGLLSALWHPEALPTSTDRPWLTLIVAGLLVGGGARLGNGCTSGHGVCGVGHLRARSIVATLTFIAAGMVTVLITRALLGA